MGIMSRLESRSSLATPEKWLVDYFSGGGPESSAGVRVTSASAMYFVAVFACINILSRTVGSLPLYLYRRLSGGGKEKARQHPLFNLMRYSPNPEMTAMRYRSTLQGHLASWGNAYSFIDWKGSGTGAGYPAAIWPLRPDRVQVERIAGSLKYSYYPGIEDIKLTQGFQIPNEYMLHIPGFGFDGVIGYSPISLAREAIGLGMATEIFGARFFGSGTNPGMIVEHPGVLKDKKSFRDAINDVHQGLGKTHRVMLLEEGMKANKVVIDPKDSQFLETRKFQITEIARLFLIPPHMIADLERATFSNIEEQGIEFVVHTMRPWFVLWEEELMRSLLRSDEREEYFFQFDVDALMRGDIQKRYAAYAVGKQWGFLSTNDIRDKENLNPVDDGDLYMVPLNMIPAKDAGKLPKAVKELKELQRRAIEDKSNPDKA
jgi:HK97 family phage portal protein